MLTVPDIFKRSLQSLQVTILYRYLLSGGVSLSGQVTDQRHIKIVWLKAIISPLAQAEPQLTGLSPALP